MRVICQSLREVCKGRGGTLPHSRGHFWSVHCRRRRFSTGISAAFVGLSEKRSRRAAASQCGYMEGRQAALLVTQIKTRCGGGLPGVGPSDDRRTACRVRPTTDGRLAAMLLEMLPFLCLSQPQDDCKTCVMYLVDLAASKSKSSSILSSCRCLSLCRWRPRSLFQDTSMQHAFSLNKQTCE